MSLHRKEKIFAITMCSRSDGVSKFLCIRRSCLERSGIQIRDTEDERGDQRYILMVFNITISGIVSGSRRIRSVKLFFARLSFLGIIFKH